MDQQRAPKSSQADIGLGRAHRLCQMTHEERLSFISEGLPIILESARGFWSAAKALEEDRPREADELEGFALEEAAKVLILLDVVRCPKKRISDRLRDIARWFYGHLARLIYVEVTGHVNAPDVNYLRCAVKDLRKTHFNEGLFGEDILPNWSLYTRESALYADIQAHESGELSWSRPAACGSGLSPPLILSLVEALATIGFFDINALTILSDVWDQVEFVDSQTCHDAERLILETLTQMNSRDLIRTSSREVLAKILRFWQLPMYALDLNPIPVSLQELQQERSRRIETYFP